MRTFSGNTVQGGAAYGFIISVDFFEQLGKTEYETKDNAARADVIGERMARFFRARVYVDNELARLAEETRQKVGEKEATIFEACRVLLKDESLSNQVTKDIQENNSTPEDAVIKAMDYVANLLQANNSDYFKSRSEDVVELREMVVHAIRTNCSPEEAKHLKGRTILVADQLTAAQLMSYDISKIKGIVLRRGSYYSHLAFLARAKNIPMLIDCDFPGKMAIAGFPGILFADEGKFIVSPTEVAALKYRKIKNKKETLAKDISNIKHKGIDPSTVYANAVNLDEVRNAVRAGLQGVGLFRSEFLYLGRTTPPSEEEQFAVYAEAARILNGKPLVVRTADFDEDKLPIYIKTMAGERGIVFSLREKTLLRTQLRAIIRASAFGRVEILLPMVRSVDEVLATRDLIEELKNELREELENKPTDESNCKAESSPEGRNRFDNKIALGVMIETPEAVEDAERISDIADFFSIGTNDLSRYALGITRSGMKPGDLTGENRDKLLSLIVRTTEAAHCANIPVMVCGEIGTAPEWHFDLIKAGVDGFSVQL